MTEPYVIQPKPKEPEPVVHRPRIGQEIMSKLDTILDAVKGEGHTESTGEGDGGAPEVTFEPNPDHLPVTAGDEEPDDEGGEVQHDDDPTAEGNRVDAFSTRHEPRFKFPGRRYASRELER